MTIAYKYPVTWVDSGVTKTKYFVSYKAAMDFVAWLWGAKKINASVGRAE